MLRVLDSASRYMCIIFPRRYMYVYIFPPLLYSYIPIKCMCMTRSGGHSVLEHYVILPQSEGHLAKIAVHKVVFDLLVHSSREGSSVHTILLS